MTTQYPRAVLVRMTDVDKSTLDFLSVLNGMSAPEFIRALIRKEATNKKESRHVV